jgi:hypothetical protein
VLFLLLMALYAISLLRFPRGALTEQYVRYASLANLAAISFIMASFSSRFVYPLLGIEGKSIWLLAAAPVRPATILAAKLGLGLLLMCPAAVALAVASQLALGIQGAEFLLGTVLVTALSCALGTLALGFGAAFAEFTSDRPGEVLGTMGGTANFLASSGLVCLVVGLWILSSLLGRTTPGGVAAACGVFLTIGAVICACSIWALRCVRGREY